MKVILYTANIGFHETDSKHVFVPEIDYKEFREPFGSLSNIDSSRYYKMMPDQFFKDYDISVYADANMTLVKPDDLLKVCQVLLDSDLSSIFFMHPERTTVIDEICECINQGREDGEKMMEQYNRYLEEGFQDDIQLTENNVILRKHNDPKLNRLGKLWFEEFLTGCKRDQISLPYVRWKMQYNFLGCPPAIKEDIFKWRPHGS